MKLTLKLSWLALAAALSMPALAADAPKSMRGAEVTAEDAAPAEKAYVGKRPGTQSPITRTFSLQPPVIPHAVENFDEVSLEGNQCLDCHGPANSKKKNAPLIGKSHFIDREGKTLPDVSALRHNCVQCHVPQADAQPLVENTFQGDRLVTGKTPSELEAANAATNPAANKKAKKK